LRDARVYSLPTWKPGSAFEGFSNPSKLENPKNVVGKSEGLANRAKRRKN
jgi:hypothetical protein